MKTKKPNNSKKQQYNPTKVNSIRKFFEQLQNDQQEQQPEPTTTTQNNTPRKSDARKHNPGIVDRTRLDATEMNPLPFDIKPAPNNLLPQQANPASSRNLPCIASRDLAVRDSCIDSEGNTSATNGNIFEQLNGIGQQGGIYRVTTNNK